MDEQGEAGVQESGVGEEAEEVEQAGEAVEPLDSNSTEALP